MDSELRLVPSRPQHRRSRPPGWMRSVRCWLSSWKPAEVGSPPVFHFDVENLTVIGFLLDARQPKSADSVSPSTTTTSSSSSSICLRSVSRGRYQTLTAVTSGVNVWSLPAPSAAAHRETRRNRRRRRRSQTRPLTPTHAPPRSTKVNAWIRVLLGLRAQWRFFCSGWEKLRLLFLNVVISSSPSSPAPPPFPPCFLLLISNHCFQMKRWPARPQTDPLWLKSVSLCRVSAISRVRKVNVSGKRRSQLRIFFIFHSSTVFGRNYPSFIKPFNVVSSALSTSVTLVVAIMQQFMLASPSGQRWCKRPLFSTPEAANSRLAVKDLRFVKKRLLFSCRRRDLKTRILVPPGGANVLLH